MKSTATKYRLNNDYTTYTSNCLVKGNLVDKNSNENFSSFNYLKRRTSRALVAQIKGSLLGGFVLGVFVLGVNLSAMAQATVNLPITGAATPIPAGQATLVYDNGGPTANYSNGCNGYVYCTAMPGYSITIQGSYSTENYSSTADPFKIFSGNGIGGTVRSNVRGSSAWFTYTGTVGEGLTIQLMSDNSTTYAGLKLLVTYSILTELNISNGSSTSIPCESNTLLFDGGGKNGAYSSNNNGYAVLNSNGSGQVRVLGLFYTESNYDFISIYDGVGTTGTLLKRYSGSTNNNTSHTTTNNNAGPIDFTGSPGQTLTVRFNSDVSTNYAGFALAAVWIAPCCTSPPPPLQVAANITVGPVRDGNIDGLGTPLLPNANMSGGDGTHHAWWGRLFNPLGTGGLINTSPAYCWPETFNGGALGGWKVDLGSSKNINGVILQGRPYSDMVGCAAPNGQFTSSVTVYVSSDNSTWTNMGTFPANTENKKIATIIFPTKAVARFVRIDGGGVFRADVISIPCGTGSHTVSVSAEIPLGATNIKWYDAPTGGTLLGTGLYLTRTISQNTTFYAASFNRNGGCESTTRVPVTAIIGKEPAAPTIVLNPLIPSCSEVVTLSVTGTDMVPEPRVGLIAHYPFNGNLNDVSGNNLNLTVVSGSASYSGGGLTFSGGTTRFESPTNSFLANDGDHTFSFYFNQTVAEPSFGKLFTWAPAGDRSPGIFLLNHGLHWRYDSDAAPCCAGSNNTGVDYSATSLNEWYHVVGIKKGSTFTYYVTNSAGITLTTTGSGVANPTRGGTAPFVFGAFAGNLAPVGAVIREFKIFDRALSAAEVQDLGSWKWYTASCGGTLVGSGPTIKVNPTVTTEYFLNAKNACGTTACDSRTIKRGLPKVPLVSAYLSNICVTETTNLTAKEMAPSEKAISYSTGTFSYVNVPNIAAYNFAGTSSTIECWVNPSSYTGQMIIYNKEDQYEMALENVTGKIQWAYAVNPSPGWAWVTTNTVVPLNTWTHIAIVHDRASGQIKTLVNGYTIHVQACTPNVDVTGGTNSFRIGNRSTNSPFYGKIDNMRLWKTARTQAQIIKDMNLEVPTLATDLIANYPLNGNGNALVGTNGTLTNAGGTTWVNPNYYTYTWTGGPSLPTPSVNESQTTGTISTTGTHNYTVTASVAGCTSPASAAVAVVVSNPSTPPTASTGGGNYCHGNVITLTQSGGTNGTGAVDVWYAAAGETAASPASCDNEGFMELWNKFEYQGTGCYYEHRNTSYSINNGIINLEAGTDADPFIWMYPLPGNVTIDANTYKYVNVRYKVTNIQGAATPRMGVLFTKRAGTCGTSYADYIGANYPFSISGQSGHTNKNINTDGNWHVISFPVNTLANWSGTVTGLRLDYFDPSPQNGSNGSKMEVDFITVSKHPMIGQGTTITLAPGDEYYPTETTRYYAKKIDNCGTTTCVSETVVLPTSGTTLAQNNESATCTVNAGEKVHFYHSSGRFIATVHATSTSLGATTATAFVDGSPQLVSACNTTNPANMTSVLQRHWVINPTIKNIAASVFLPYSNTEYTNLTTAANNNVNLNDNVNGYIDLKLSKYSGPNNVNDVFEDNCTSLGGNEGTTIHDQIASGTITTTNFIKAIPSSRYLKFDIPNFSEFWIHGSINNSPLPVTLTNLSATCDKDVKLFWTTASEQNSDRFIIEKSRDLEGWIFVAEQAAAGNSNTTINYTQIDNNTWNGVTYYRLRQIDFNGDETTYGPISVSCIGNENNMTVYPNPNNGSFTVEITSDETHADAQLILTDVTGKVIYTQKVNVEAGTTQVLMNNLDIEAGTYLVSLRTSDSGMKQLRPVKVMVKQ